MSSVRKDITGNAGRVREYKPVLIDPIIAVVCSDIHLSLRPPAARSGESNWLVACSRVLRQLRSISKGVPVLCAGDVFDSWASPPELINFALDQLPTMFSVPGQHDLPLHRLDLLHRSAYAVLERAGKIITLSPKGILLGEMRVCGFAWGEQASRPVRGSERHRVAIVHRFVWNHPSNGYRGALRRDKVRQIRRDYRGFHLAFFGDNHRGFVDETGNPTIVNCGTMLRRKADEINYAPAIWVLHRSGRLDKEYLDISLDVIARVKEAGIEEDSEDLRTLVAELRCMRHDPLDFVSAYKRALRKEGEQVREVGNWALDDDAGDDMSEDD